MKSLTPRQALGISVLAALLTILMKAGAWWLTGSVGFLSDALESLVNLAGAGFAFAMVSWAQVPADDEHPFGHGKAEYFSAGFEGVLIFVAALAILVAAAERLLDPQPIESLGLGSSLTVGASLLNFLVARMLFRVARTHRSVALEADARHLIADVWTSAGVIVGVSLASISGWLWLDPVVAAGVALNILREGWKLMCRSAGGLMDRALEPEEIAEIEAVLDRFAGRGCRFDNLRTRASGAVRFAYVDLRVPGDWSVSRSHALADEIEQAVEAAGFRLSTHVEPLHEETAPRTDEPLQ